jgi:translocation and assembly module TamB
MARATSPLAGTSSAADAGRAGGTDPGHAGLCRAFVRPHARADLDFTGGQQHRSGGQPSPATEDVEDVAVTVNVSGRAYNPQITFSSVPGLPQDEIMSRSPVRQFDRQPFRLAGSATGRLAQHACAARGGGLNPLGKLRSAAGIDRLRILGPDEATGRGTALAAGQYITNDIYVELITDARFGDGQPAARS